jgi:hypothetical protein
VVVSAGAPIPMRPVATAAAVAVAMTVVCDDAIVRLCEFFFLGSLL